MLKLSVKNEIESKSTPDKYRTENSRKRLDQNQCPSPRTLLKKSIIFFRSEKSRQCYKFSDKQIDARQTANKKLT